MAERIAEIAWLVLGGYAALGACVALIVFTGGLRRFDPAAAAAPWRVKVAITPGIITLWPLILLRVLGVRPPEDRA